MQLLERVENRIDCVDRMLELAKPNTRSKYAPIWRWWLDFIKDPITATALDAAEFIEQCKKRHGLQGKPVSKATLTGYIAALYKCYQTLIEEGHIQRNPFSALWREYRGSNVAQRRPTQMIPFDRVFALISAPSEHLRLGRRDRAILALLFAGALRRGELVKLRMCDVRVKPDCITLTLRETKNGSDAEQTLPAWASDFVGPYIAQRYAEGAKADAPLLVDYTRHDRPGVRQICANLVYRRFKFWADSIGLPSTASPHWARATAITKLLTDGVPHHQVREFSRHSSIQMVEIYDKRRTEGKDAPGRKLKY